MNRELSPNLANRSEAVKKNVIGSGIMKLISIVLSLLLVPLTINYVNPTQYGIWLTLSSIIIWIGYFDFGMTLGFKNKFTEALSIDNTILAKQYVSTTYVAIFAIFLSVSMIALVTNQFINWPSILNVDAFYGEELRRVFDILIICFCTSTVLKIVCVMLDACLKMVLSSIIQTLGQAMSLVFIYLLTLHHGQGNLTELALYYNAVPLVVFFVANIIVFRHPLYRVYTPSYKHVRIELVKNILVLGGRFFTIMMCTIFVFQMINVIISRNFGPDTVTQYNIAFKYFNVLYMALAIILNPLWVAFTDAYTKKDKQWMTHAVSTMEKIAMVCVAILFVMILISPWVYRIWVGDSVVIPLETSIIISVYVFIQIIANIYMYIINGIGKVTIQMVVYLVFSFISLPLMDYFSKVYGLTGMLMVPIMAYAVLTITGKIQLTKLINSTAKGLWIR